MTTPYGWPLFVLRMRPRERWQAIYDRVYAAISDAGAITSPLAQMIIANNWPAIVEALRRDTRNARRRERYRIRKAQGATR